MSREVSREDIEACMDWLEVEFCSDFLRREEKRWTSEIYRDFEKRYCFSINLANCDTVDECFELWFDKVKRAFRRTGITWEKIRAWAETIEPYLYEEFVGAFIEYVTEMIERIERGEVG